MRQFVLFIFVLWSFSAVLSQSPKTFSLIKNGSVAVELKYNPQLPPRTLNSIIEFKKYLYKISGNDSITNFNLKKDTLWLGYNKELPALFPEIDFTSLNQEEILIACKPPHMLIMGRDAYTSTGLNTPFGKKNALYVQNEYGTSNAIFSFLQDFLEVRWFFPGVIGEDIIVNPNVSFNEFTHRYNPPFKSRNMLFLRSSLYHQKSSLESQSWAIHLRLAYSSTKILNGHAFKDWYTKYYDEYPEIFAIHSDGTRLPIYNAKSIKLCQSNTLIDSIWISEVKNQLKEFPYRTIFSTGSNDGYTHGHCTCFQCELMGIKNPGTTNVSTTEIDIAFTNRLNRALQKTFPNRGYKTTMLVYGSATKLPVKTLPDSSVVLTNVASFHLEYYTSTDTNMIDPIRAQLSDWAPIVNEQIWRPNLQNSAGLMWGCADVAPHQSFDDFKFAYENKVVGVKFDYLNDFWGTQSIQNYVLAQLAWNPNSDSTVLFSDYFKRCYGKSNHEMKRYWEFIESSRKQFYLGLNNIPYKRFHMPAYFNKKWFKMANKLLRQAKEKFDDNEKMTKHYQRIIIAEQGIKHMEIVTQIRCAMINWENKPSSENKQKVLALWEDLWAFHKMLHPIVVHQVVFKNPTKNKLFMGLHPDNPMTRKVRKRTGKIAPSINAKKVE